MQDADDARRALVARALHLQARDQSGVGGVPGECDRPGVRSVPQQCAQRDDELHSQRLGEVDQLGAEGAPAHRRLDALHEHQVARRLGGTRFVYLHPGPGDLALARIGEANARTVGLEVVELLGLDAREARCLQRGGEERDRARSSVAGVVPALERTHQRGGPEAIRTAVPDQGLHPNHRTS